MARCRPVGDPGRDRGRCRGRCSPDPPARLLDADHAVGRRHGGVVAALRRRYPGIVGPGNEDICYATTNRQTRGQARSRRASTCSWSSARPTRPTRCGWSRSRERAGAAARLIAARRRDRLGLARRGRDPRRHGRRLGARAPGRGGGRRLRARSTVRSSEVASSPKRRWPSSCRRPADSPTGLHEPVAVYTTCGCALGRVPRRVRSRGAGRSRGSPRASRTRTSCSRPSEAVSS